MPTMSRDRVIGRDPGEGSQRPEGRHGSRPYGPIELGMSQDTDHPRKRSGDVELLGAEQRHVADPQGPSRGRGESLFRSGVLVKITLIRSSVDRPVRSSIGVSNSTTASVISTGSSAVSWVAPRRARVTANPSGPIWNVDEDPTCRFIDISIAASLIPNG